MPLPAIIFVWAICSILLTMALFGFTMDLEQDNPWSIKALAERLRRFWTNFTDNFPDLDIQPTFAEFAFTGWLLICTPVVCAFGFLATVAAISTGIPVWMAFGLGWSFHFIKRKAKQYSNDPRRDRSVRS